MGLRGGHEKVMFLMYMILEELGDFYPLYKITILLAVSDHTGRFDSNGRFLHDHTAIFSIVQIAIWAYDHGTASTWSS